MKRYYKFGEIILALREEYKECKPLLEELSKNIGVNPQGKYYFTGHLSLDNKVKNLEDRKIQLHVEKEYLNILKKIQYLKHDWYGAYLYTAIFDVQKEPNGLYGLKYDNIFTPVDGKKFVPGVEIKDQVQFSKVVDELLSKDLLNLKAGHFNHNGDRIILNFDNAYISTPLGNKSTISWDGITDDINYSITKDSSPSLIENILSLEMPVDKISHQWVEMLEKHENIFGEVFDVDINAQEQKGVLKVSSIERMSNITFVKLLKK